MARNRAVTVRQMQDAEQIIQRVLETETYALTRAERLAMMDTKKSLQVLIEMREGK